MGIFLTYMFKFRNTDIQDVPIWESMLSPVDQCNKVLLAQNNCPVICPVTKYLIWTLVQTEFQS